jgi:hypothetical protein
MATLVLGFVGRAILGPVGGIVGTLVGAGIDRRLFGRRSQAARSATPDIQSASYGEPLPIVHGRMRVSGNLAWAAPVKETAVRSGGGKRGPATTSYAYSASFAVLLSARPIIGVGRIWADGKLIRDAGGQWLTPATMRIHSGSERQQPDPLIAAAEGAAPAFRGLAYVVFEDFALADFGNRLPNLSFEVIADAGPVDLGSALAAVAGRAGVVLPVAGDFPEVNGFYAGATGPVSDLLGPALGVSGAVLAAGRALVGPGTAARPLDPAQSLDSEAGGAGRARSQMRDRHRRSAAGTAPDAVELGYYDVDRDYQPGLQRFRLRPGERVASEGLPVALAASAAKQLGRDQALRLMAGRQRRTLRLPWRHLGLLPGHVLDLPDGRWRVTETRFESFVLAVELVRLPGGTAPPPASDGGRGLDHGDQPAGPTTLVAMDLPPLPGALPDRPMLWLAGAGLSPGWRRAGVQISLDGGQSYEFAGLLSAPVVMGTAQTVLPPASQAGWDRIGTVDVQLLAQSMWLEARSEEAVLAGANLAVLGDELIQFTQAAAIGSGRFRLSGLLRGRRGSEWAIGEHALGERFVLIDPVAMLALPLPLERLGETVLLKAQGSGDAGAAVQVVRVESAAIRPLAPVHLRYRRWGGQLHFSWIPQSRAGFGWPDLTDVPLGEAAPAWRVSLRDSDGLIDSVEVSVPTWSTADRAGPLWLEVAQIGATLGRPSTLAID